jgi:hypothetical protein
VRELEVGNELDCVVPDGSCIFSGSTSAFSGYDFLRCALFHIAVKDSPLKFVSLVNNRMAHCCYYKTCLLMTTLVLAPPF